MKTYVQPEFEVIRDQDRCIRCEVCVRQCGWDVHEFDKEDDIVRHKEEKCVGCQRCTAFCPTRALTIKSYSGNYNPNANWTEDRIRDLVKQSEGGGVMLIGMGCDRPLRIYWDHLLLNASQVTNPSIDPLREPMELTTFLGAKPDSVKVKDGKLETKLPPQVKIDTPIMFSAISYGAISYRVQESLMRAAEELGTICNTGEGGWPKDLRKYASNVAVQCASGRYGIDREYLNLSRFVEIKVGQGAKPGIGGHLPGTKVTEEVSRTRMIPLGTDAISPAPHHDIYSIEDLSQLIFALKEATNYEKPVSVKIAAVHNCAAIASGIVRAGADIVSVDGLRGGTGAAPKIIRDNVGIPVELAVASIDTRLREEGIRNRCSIVAGGGFRNSGDVIKAIALGADAVYIGTPALMAMGCTLCQKCYSGICNWGICTQNPYLTKRINPDIATERVVNLIRGWSHEIKEMIGGLGVNAIESLRGNRLHLRGVELHQWELDVLGVRGAGT